MDGLDLPSLRLPPHPTRMKRYNPMKKATEPLTVPVTMDGSSPSMDGKRESRRNRRAARFD
jgi:hypothetical protein